MTDFILETKISLPKYRSKILSRPRLYERLDQGLNGTLTLISAPAGYGKTTLITSWVKNLKRSFAWYALDAQDNDPVTFLTYLVAAIQSANSGFGETIKKSLETSFQAAQKPNLENILTKIINEIASLSNETVLILDDYHEIEENLIHKIISDLLSHQPPQLHIILITRIEPPLSLAKLRVRSEMVEIRAKELRFLETETRDFLNQIMSLRLSEEEIIALGSRTEGWIAGLLLAAHSLQYEPDHKKFIEAFKGTDRHVVDYLIEEVLEHLPDEIQEFILCTSILDRLSAPLCQVLVYGEGTADRCQEILELLERNNLFTIPLDNHRSWYRYHPLFAELLRYRLALHAPEKVIDLHLLASKWLEANGFLTEAINHALIGKDYERYLDLIETHALEAISKGEIRKVQRWFESLSPDLSRSRPFLYVSYAWTILLTNYSDPPPEIDEWIQAAERVLSLREAESDSIETDKNYQIREHIYALRTLLALSRNADPYEVIELGKQALELIDESNLWVRSILLHSISAAYLIVGDINSAKQFDLDALHHAKISGMDYIGFGVYYDSAVIELRQGRLREAESICREGLDFVARQGKKDSATAGFLYALHGNMLVERDQLESAETVLKKGLDLLNLIGDEELLGLCCADLSRLYQARGDWSNAHRAISEISAYYADQLSNRSEDFISALRALLWLREAEHNPDRYRSAYEWLEKQAPALNADFDFPIIFPVSERDYTVQTITTRVYIAHTQHLPSHHRGEAIQPVHRFLDGQLKIAEKRGWGGRVIELEILKALALETVGELDRALDTLSKAFKLGEPESYVHIFVDEGQHMAKLLNEAAAREIYPEYVGRLLAAYPKEKPKLFQVLGEDGRDVELVEPLSDRELEVLTLIAQGLTNNEISQKLHITVNTVKGHSRNIYAKLAVKNRSQAIFRARRIGLLSGGDH
jgi:LuxR family maltose regulon positive regulatory protein